MTHGWMWAGLVLLGLYHGLNPAMGWLFAVALGYQEKTGRAVVRALVPLGVGHLASIALVVGVGTAASAVLPLGIARILGGALLIGFGVYRLIRRRHPRWVGMRVGSRDLATWSFLMATAHGAGLMLLPFVIRSATPAMSGMSAEASPSASAMSMPVPVAASTLSWWQPLGPHTVGYLVATALIALVVYHKVGVAVLRQAWLNFDLLWIGALIAMGAVTLVT